MLGPHHVITTLKVMKSHKALEFSFDPKIYNASQGSQSRHRMVAVLGPKLDRGKEPLATTRYRRDGG